MDKRTRSVTLHEAVAADKEQCVAMTYNSNTTFGNVTYTHRDIYRSGSKERETCGT